jgi:transposase
MKESLHFAGLPRRIPAQCNSASPPAGAEWRPLQPHDNPVERTWGALKAWLANNPTLTIQGRIRQVHAFFRERTTCP